MAQNLSKRLSEIIEAIPLANGLRILEIGCSTGAAAREISKRIGHGYILAIDRSAKAIQQAVAGSQTEIKTGHLAFRQVAVENFEPEENDELFDIAFAIRVGALDGRHPEIESQALSRIAKALKKEGRLFIDGGTPLKEISLEKYR
jgi:SAM-dependent methyltransferase